MELIKVLLVGEHTIFRQGLRMLLESEPDIAVVGEAGGGEEAIQSAKKVSPNVVILEVAMPGPDALDAISRMVLEIPFAKLLVLSSEDDKGFERRMTHAGAMRYLCKQTTVEDLIQIVRAECSGKACFSGDVSKEPVFCRSAAVLNSLPIGRHITLLTAREAEVLQLIAGGMANKQIAADLCISIKTVEKHRQKVMNKLKIHNTAGLTRYAIANGILRNGSLAAA